MLQCKNIMKDYVSGDEIVHALKGVSLSFREREFVSILGQSGCGKTTFLNIIGGLDHYTSGDLIVNGKSTKDYSDKDWDTYRNHQVGFVFQSYNLIMHQSVLSNVELALTLTGVNKEERRKRAIDALNKVGLSDQIHKKPTQMSGGQMQRVAIARAIVNNPDIILADEPTGALDSATSVQIMEILKEISKDKLVIMVTHNPQLADEYSSRIIRLKDGSLVSDSNPFNEQEMNVDTSVLKRPGMSFIMACSLSLNNLMTKKARTFLTSFAGSIGIIGIALIMSLSHGMQSYIDQMENDTMASYPIEIQANSSDMSTLMTTMMGMKKKTEGHKGSKIYSRPYVEDVLESLSSSKKNNLSAFKSYIESNKGKEFRRTAKAIEYDYNLNLQVYNENTDSGLVQVSPNGLLDKLGMSDMMSLQSQFMDSSSMTNDQVWLSLPESKKLRDDEYQLVEGKWPTNYNEVVLEVDENNEITDYALYSLGLLDQDELVKNYQKILNGETDKISKTNLKSYSVDDILNLKFRLVLNNDLYQKVNGLWINQSENESYMQDVVSKSPEIKVVGIIKPSESTVSQPTMGGVYYTKAMEEYVTSKTENSQIVQEQKSNPNINIFTQTEFASGQKMSMSNLTNEQMMQLSSMSQEELMNYMNTYNENINATYDSNLTKLGVVDYSTPTKISLYASSFDGKEKLSDLITSYNKKQTKSNVITYNDFIGTMLSSVTSVVNIISYVLIAFVSVSLIVSSIMIGIITYISVLERTKEIGILRSIGASKKDITRVFNAETFIIGLISGVLGILITLVLNVPISVVVKNMTGVSHIAKLPVNGAIFLIFIDLVLTILAGLIPSKIASKKDPVEALRSE
ncbi:ABC transporter ATP-binding protein/permease [Holdemanella biformis]|uniref:ABC transporter ATP-binding protein/permease n=1 Tax=Holdemanella biformis TaxID=1735 RepID=UPI00189912DE|nr:ABC transporter ATP-binding protein/permease [Holdemanella biformis]